MDSPTALAPGSTPSSNEESTRVKFLCSFLGSILPRPQDGKLRYVGGETRIVSVPRDIRYEEFMAKMKELCEGVAVLKYQQPDEDLDALVSVVNDDDVTNMMEEYDKLGSGDGFTRLRIFLFSQPDHDVSPHFIDGDEKDSEKRYVDALNNLNDGLDLKKQQVNDYDSSMIADHFISMNLEGSVHSQRNYDFSLPHNNLCNLTVPQLGSGQHQLIPQRYNEMEAPWSPAYYSPRHHGLLDPRLSGEVPSSPSSARYHIPFSGELPEDFSRQQITQQPMYDHPPQFTENAVWLPNGIISGDKAGFPGNILHGHGTNTFEGNSICEQCRMSFQRSQPEQPNIGGGYPHAPHHCVECSPNRDTFIMNNTDKKIHHGGYNEIHNHERRWALHHPVNHRVEEPRPHIPPSGRINDSYIVDNTGMSLPICHLNLTDGHQRPSNYVHHEDPLRYGHLPFAYGTDNLGPGSHGHIPMHPSWRNAQPPVHIPPSYEAPIPAQQANGTINPGCFRGTIEGIPRLRIGMDNPNPWAESSQKMMGCNESLIPEYPHGHALKLNQTTHVPEKQPIVDPGPSQSSNDLTTLVTPNEIVKLEYPPLIVIGDNPEQRNCTDVVKLEDPPLTVIDNNPEQKSSTDTMKLEDPPLIMIDDNRKQMNSTDVTDAMRPNEDNMRVEEEKVVGHVEKVDISDIESILSLEQTTNTDNIDDVESLEPVTSQSLTNTEESGDIEKLCDTADISAPLKHELSLNHLSVVAELTASVKQEVLNNVEEVKAKIKENDEHGSAAKGAVPDELHGSSDCHEDAYLGSDNDNLNFSKIELTKAEEEAISRGLQTIKNDDLEEFREIGSGTYGAVYHGKWKGSDVAIKRIKASCFAGKPSERERLIADFWKEALTLGSLHHPNVVSFYGIVRDGPDGSLATVTEFMINGSLKQFLQKKDRTIDRRKRLIIAMDSAFGMEYLHVKNIVHFDLKCENLLVNMRDPHRPICKIGDLGLSKVKEHTLVSGGVRGTLPWMAPELLSGKSHMVSEKIDVYSFGIVMWELLTGEEPYADMHCASIIGGIVNNMLRPQIPAWCDPEWKSLMESCWASEPSERPSFSEISQKLRNMAAAMNLK